MGNLLIEKEMRPHVWIKWGKVIFVSSVFVFLSLIPLLIVLDLVMDKIERWNFPYQSGDEIAEILINDAKHNGGIASLSSIADKVCVSPDGVGPRRNVDKFFRDIPVGYIETDASEGVWFIYIQHNNSVIIYGVSQTVLKWGSIMEDPPTPYNQNELCPQTVQITNLYSRPSITRFF